MFKSIPFKVKLFVLIVLGLAISAGGYYITAIYQYQMHSAKVEETPSNPSNDQNTVSLLPQASSPTPAKPQPTPQETSLEAKYQAAYDSFEAKKYSDAIKLADEIMKEDDKFYKAYNIKGIALAYSGQANKGLENIDKALALNPDYGYARFNKALTYELTGRYDLSLQWYDKALQVENYVWSYYGKASIYGRRGDVPNTVKFLKMAIDLDNGVKEIAREEADFNPVKKSKEFQDLLK